MVTALISLPYRLSPPTAPANHILAGANIGWNLWIRKWSDLRLYCFASHFMLHHVT